MNKVHSKRDEYLNWPNYLSFFRIVLVPVVMLLIALMDSERVNEGKVLLGRLAAVLFLIGGLTDLLDGYVARRLKINHVFGKFLDPLADKLMVSAVFIMLVPSGRFPGWLAVMFISREVIITALRGVAVSEKIVIAASYWGKKKTVLQNIGLIGLLLHYPVFKIHVLEMGWVFIVCSLIISVTSGFFYVRDFFIKVQEQVSHS